MSTPEERRRESARTARTLYFVEPGKVEVREERIHRGSGELLVTSQLSGISHGTELLFFRGSAPTEISEEPLEVLRGGTGYPLKYGYMNVGITEEGQRVFAFHPHQDLFFAHPESLYHLPDNLSFEDAVLLPTVETALGIVHDLAPRYGETILLAGLGMVGLTTASILRRMNLEVVAMDPAAPRRGHAERLGCHAVEPGRIGEFEHFDAGINTSGDSRALQLCMDAVAAEGTVIEASWYGRRSAELSLGGHFHRGRVTLRSAQFSRINPALAPRWTKERRFGLAMETAQELRPGRYISGRYPFERAQEAFERIDSGDPEVLQLVLEP